VEIVLVRHALPVTRVVADGPADPELADDGRRQADRLAGYLFSETIDAIYSSPLRRAVQTAEPLAALVGCDIRLEPGLAEWDQTSSEYIPVEVMKATNHPQWQAMVRGEWTGSDESSDEFHARVVATVDRLVAEHSGQRIVLVCHGGVVNTYLGHVLGRPDTTPFFYPAYTSIHRVVAARSGERSILSVNEIAHLRDTGLHTGLHQTPSEATS
jgi:2,3-bisphosphoglycerate-dependent phosphoglycerate mutase